jgi:protein-S-isoprenylcysteine O-methyltransferase Ste14
MAAGRTHSPEDSPSRLASAATGPGEERREAAGVIAPPPLLYLAALAVGFGLDALLPSPDLSRAVAWSLGGAVLIVGLCLSAWFFVTFRRAGTPVDVRKPAEALVTAGPFRFSRNPGYLSLTLIYVGIALVASVLWAFVSLAAILVVVQEGVIKREERYLARRFGEPYLRYKQRTRRWL